MYKSVIFKGSSVVSASDRFNEWAKENSNIKIERVSVGYPPGERTYDQHHMIVVYTEDSESREKNTHFDEEN